jgi:glycosyltransferase involved in cell wall biosynthesis
VTRLGDAPSGARPVPGVRVILDARPLQEPERAPITALYLQHLLAAFARTPVAGESFVVLYEAGAPEVELPDGLPVAGRRPLPRTRVLRAGALTVDPFFLRGAAFLAARGARDSGANGVVYHAAGGFAPLGIRHPLVVTLLDLAPWELPERYQQTTPARFGLRLRARILRDAAAVIVPAESTGSAVRRVLHVQKSAVQVVRLAPRPAFAAPISQEAIATATARHGLAEPYIVYPGRYDARHDLATLLAAMARLPLTRLLLVGTSPDERASLARAAAAEGVDHLLSYAPLGDEAEVAALVAGARAAVLPVRSDANGHPALEAIAAGTPVVASAMGALPEVVGAAGILVEPRSPDRLATALGALFAETRAREAVAAAVAAAAVRVRRRTWDDVAAETRAVYASAVAAAGSPAAAAPTAGATTTDRSPARS